MLGNYNRINKIERIQNERWHKQYLVHRDDFQNRLKMNTEKFLYHGCSDVAADSIIKEYFNRSFAGENGKCHWLFIGIDQMNLFDAIIRSFKTFDDLETEMFFSLKSLYLLHNFNTDFTKNVSSRDTTVNHQPSVHP